MNNIRSNYFRTDHIKLTCLENSIKFNNFMNNNMLNEQLSTTTISFIFNFSTFTLLFKTIATINLLYIITAIIPFLFLTYYILRELLSLLRNLFTLNIGWRTRYARMQNNAEGRAKLVRPRSGLEKNIVSNLEEYF